MGPIDPVGFTGMQAGRSNGAVGVDGPDQLSRSSAGSLGSPMRGIAQDAGALGQLIKNLGGASLDESTFQMLIGLIILLAILEKLQGGGESPQAALAPLGQGGGQSQFGDINVSQTSIQIEQTTTTMVFGSADAYSSGAASDDASAGGSTIDVAA